jgi:hypothetical protein
MRKRLNGSWEAWIGNVLMYGLNRILHLKHLLEILMQSKRDLNYEDVIAM